LFVRVGSGGLWGGVVGLTVVRAEDLALLADAGAWFGHGLWTWLCVCWC
jgi:hypothetical protein